MSTPTTAEQRTKRNEYMRGYYVRNRETRQAYNRKYSASRAPFRNLYERTRKYGLTIEEYERMKISQDYKCASCHKTPTPSGRSKDGFHIDHDHACCPDDSSCGKCVRGLLCGPCNFGLGNFGDDIDNLRQAITYLENHNSTKHLKIDKPPIPTFNEAHGGEWQ